MNERRRRPLLGEETWLEVFHKLATVAALGFAGWVYFHSVQPVFQKERQLQRERERTDRMAREVARMESDLRVLWQQLEEHHWAAAAQRRGIILYHLSEIRRQVVADALAYRRTSPAAFDLRDYCAAYAAALLERLGSPPPGSPESYRQAALEYFRRFATEIIPPGQSEPYWLDPLLDTFDRQEGGRAARP